MNKKVIRKQLENKVKNSNLIRVIHKKAGQLPTIKIITNIVILKKAIIKRKRWNAQYSSYDTQTGKITKNKFFVCFLCLVIA